MTAEPAAIVAVEPDMENDIPDGDTETTGATPREIVRVWAEKNARWLLLALVFALLPYFLMCNGIALFVVRGLLASGGCSVP